MGIPQLIEYSISDFFCVVCFGIFMERRYSWKVTAGMLAANWAVLLSMEYLRFWLYGLGIDTRSTIVAATAIGLVILLLISEYRDSRTIFILLMAISYCMCGNMAAKLLNFLQVPLLWAVAVEIVVHLVLLYLLARFLLPPIRNLQQGYRREWRLFDMVLGMLSCCMYLLYACLKRPDATIFHHVVPLFYLICVYIMVTFALWLLVRINEDEIEASQRKILDAGMEVLKREVEQMCQTEKRIAAYNHDSRHFNRMMAGMMAEGNYKGVGEALEKLPSLDSVLEVGRHCENLVFNGVLSYYSNLAKERGIEMDVHADLPECGGEKNWEHAVIFENLLAQAVELSSMVKEQEQRRIHVRIVPENSQILYEIRSTFAVAVSFDKDPLLPVLTLQERHGFGMRSIKLCVERWKGSLDCGVDKGWFFVRMLV